MDDHLPSGRPFVNEYLPLVNSITKTLYTQLIFTLEFMGHQLLKYLLVLGVALTGFQFNAYGDDDKDKSKDKTVNTNVSAKDSIIIKVSDDDVSVGDTLVFDDYDDDEGATDNSSSIASTDTSVQKVIATTTITSCCARVPRDIICAYIVSAPSSEDNDFQDSNGEMVPSEEDATLTLKLYPNPANANDQSVTIQHNLSSEAAIQIFTIDGKLVKHILAHSKQTIIDDLTTGFYMVNITSNNQTRSSRLIVK